jgi:hypothetical protein
MKICLVKDRWIDDLTDTKINSDKEVRIGKVQDVKDYSPLQISVVNNKQLQDLLYNIWR